MHADRRERILEAVTWAESHRRTVMVGVVALVAVVAGFFYYQDYRAKLAERASVRLQEIQLAAQGQDSEVVRSELRLGEGDVLAQLVDRAHPHVLVAVHVAVGALVPRAADGGLQDVGMCLAGRAVETAFVAHGIGEGGEDSRRGAALPSLDA